MASSSPMLRGAAARLTQPGIVGQSVMGLVAIYYGTLMVKLPPGTLLLFVGLAVAIVIALIGVAEGVNARRLSTLRRLGRSSAPPSKDDLVAALREVVRIPDLQFWMGLFFWVAGAGLLSLSYRQVAGVHDGSILLRIFSLGVLFGPLSSALSMLLGLMRSRELVSLLAAQGLSPAEVTAALPAHRSQLRARVVTFIAVAVISPALMTYEVATSLARDGAVQLIEAPATVDRAELAQSVKRVAMVKIGALLLLVFTLAMVAAHVAGSALGTPMRRIADEAHRIASGQLDEVQVIPAEDEVWAVSRAFGQMHLHLSSALKQLKGAGLRIGSTTEQIVATSERYVAGATSQASSLNQTSATTEELARSAAQISDNAAEVSSLAERTLEAARGGQSSATAFASSLGRMRQDNEAIVQAVLKLNKRVQQIGRIVEFINSVADRSDLLALNADLEGTKAGEVGRGFSLVAAEMRRLAENVIESTKEIEGLIEEIREATRATVSATEAGLAVTLGGGDLATAIANSLTRIVELAGQTSEAVKQISVSTREQRSGTDQLATAMADILRVTQQNLDATRQVSSANADLAHLAKDLRGVVDRFRLES